MYYLRDRTGKSARIAEKIKKKIGVDVDVKPEEVNEQNVVPPGEKRTVDLKEEKNESKDSPKVEVKKQEPKKESTKEKK